jgi:2-oxoglutarate ferredoxin oxidoreductase subunit gamma
LRIEVKFAGFGGQGIQLISLLLGRAATLFEGKNAVVIGNYGPEARGGVSYADVIISDEPIYYPRIHKPEILVAMSSKAFCELAGTVSESGLIIVDETLVKMSESESRIHMIPATSIAEKLGLRVAANMVILGFLLSIVKVVNYNSLRQAIISFIPKKSLEVNLKAFETGYNYKA